MVDILEKPINIVLCLCMLSTLCGKFFYWPWDDSLLEDKKVQRSNRKALLFEVRPGVTMKLSID